MYIAVFSISMANQEWQNAKFFGTWKIVSFGVFIYRYVWFKHQMSPSKDFNQPIRKAYCSCCDGHTNSEAVWRKLCTVQPTDVRRTRKLLDVQLRLHPSMNWKSGWKVLCPSLKKCGDGTHAWVWLSYGEFGCLAKGVCFELSNGNI